MKLLPQELAHLRRWVFDAEVRHRSTNDDAIHRMMLMAVTELDLRRAQEHAATVVEQRRMEEDTYLAFKNGAGDLNRYMAVLHGEAERQMQHEFAVRELMLKQPKLWCHVCAMYVQVLQGDVGSNEYVTYCSECGTTLGEWRKE